MEAIEAIRVVGTNVQVDVETFRSILGMKEGGIVVTGKKGAFIKKYVYQVTYNGMTFMAISQNSIPIPKEFEVVIAKRITSPLIYIANG